MSAGSDHNKGTDAGSLVVHCDDWLHFGRTITPDLERGVILVATPQPPPALSVVKLYLHLPEGHVVEFPVTVIQLTKSSTDGRGEVTGCVVQLAPLPPHSREELSRLLAFGRAQVEAETEVETSRGSFGSYLLERSQTLSPVALAQALAELQPSRASRGPRPPGRETAQSGVRRLALGSAGVAAAGGRASTPSGRVSVPPERPATGRFTNPPERVSSPPQGEAKESLRPPDETDEGWHTTRDPQALRDAMNHLSHRRYGEALNLLRTLAKNDRRDRDAYKWYFVAKARASVAAHEHDRAATAYERVLRMDDRFREAREFLRQHARRRRLSAIPFSKFFSK